MRKFSMVIISIMMFILVACTNKAQVSNVEVTEVLMQDTVAPTMMTTALGMTGCANTASLPNDNEQLKIVTEVDKVVESNIETGQTGANAKITYKQDEVENVVARETIKKEDSNSVIALNETQKKFLNGISSTEEFLKLCPTEADALKLETNGYCLVQVDGVDKLMTEDETKAYYLDVLKSGNKVRKFTVYEGKAYQIYQSLYNETIGKAEIESKAQAKAQKEAEEKAHTASLVKMLDNEIHLQNAIGSNGIVGNSIYWDGGAILDKHHLKEVH